MFVSVGRDTRDERVTGENKILGENTNSPDTSQVTIFRMETERCDLADK